MCLWNTMSPYMTFDLEGWPWPWPFTTQNVQLDEIHMHVKYKIASFNIAEVTLHEQFWPIYLTLKDDLDLSPLKMCSSMRYTCIPNIKLLSSILQKLWPMCLDFVFYDLWLSLTLTLSPLKKCRSMSYTWKNKKKCLTCDLDFPLQSQSTCRSLCKLPTQTI